MIFFTMVEEVLIDLLCPTGIFRNNFYNKIFKFILITFLTGYYVAPPARATLKTMNTLT